jgi:Putative MetA-pathway of phenol degradation
MSMLRRFALAALLAAVPASVASAQPSTASDTADRPGFADSTQVIGRGRLQLESGIQFDHIRVDPGTERALTVPQWQFRTGLSSRVELSLWWEGFVHVSTDDHGQTGETDPRVGGKVQLVDRQAVALALIGSVGLPVASRLLSTGDPDPLLRMAWSAPLTSSLGLSGTVDVAADRRDGLWGPRPAISAALDGGFGPSVGGFLGVVVEGGEVGAALQIWTAEAGVTRALGPRRQIDLSGGRRLAGGLTAWFVGGGFIQRIR